MRVPPHRSCLVVVVSYLGIEQQEIAYDQVFLGGYRIYVFGEQPKKLHYVDVFATEDTMKIR